jgi:hypothetical protein
MSGFDRGRASPGMPLGYGRPYGVGELRLDERSRARRRQRTPMNPLIPMIAVSVGLGIAMVAAQLAGRALAKRWIAAHGHPAVTDVRVVNATVFGLLSLLIAFTFSGANTRFEARRELVKEQINALGTAWMRLDLLPAQDREPARTLFRRYVDGLSEAPKRILDREAFAHIVKALAQIQDQLWRLSVKAAESEGNVYVPTLVLPPLNQAFDLSNSRLMAARTHVQPALIGFLLVLAVLSAVIVGQSQSIAGDADFTYMVIFSAVVALALYVILDLEFPSVGLIRLEAGVDFMSEFRASLG